MPIYQCQCQCGLHFEKHVAFSKRNDPINCPDCNAVADKLLPETVAGVFRQEVTGPVPQNTGIHSLDVHIDRVIGQSSAQGWDAHRLREMDKKEVLRSNPDADPHGLTRRADGTWRPLTEEERGVQLRALTINEGRMQHRHVDSERRKKTLAERRQRRSR